VDVEDERGATPLIKALVANKADAASLRVEDDVRYGSRTVSCKVPHARCVA
jgi:hypothetical protein